MLFVTLTYLTAVLSGLKILALFNKCNFTKKAVRIINFQPRNSDTSPLFKQNSILKFSDKICLENILFVSKCWNNRSPSIFNMCFSFSSNQYNCKTSSFTQGNLMKLFYKTNRYGKYSITVSAVESWNRIQKTTKKYAT